MRRNAALRSSVGAPIHHRRTEVAARQHSLYTCRRAEYMCASAPVARLVLPNAVPGAVTMLRTQVPACTSPSSMTWHTTPTVIRVLYNL